jgi:hypothetical protein
MCSERDRVHGCSTVVCTLVASCIRTRGRGEVLDERSNLIVVCPSTYLAFLAFHFSFRSLHTLLTYLIISTSDMTDSHSGNGRTTIPAPAIGNTTTRSPTIPFSTIQAKDPTTNIPRVMDFEMIIIMLGMV